MGPATIALGLIHQERGNHHPGRNLRTQEGAKHAARARQLTPQAPREHGGGLAMFRVLARIFYYQCACCDKTVPFGRYMDGAYYCLECSRGEHRHAGWGTKAA